MAKIRDVPLAPIQDAARELQVSRTTLDRLARGGKIRKWKRTGDKRVWVDLDEARRALGWREV